MVNILSIHFSSCVLSHVWFFLNPWAVASQAPLSRGFSRQEYWSGLPFPSPGNLSDPGIKLGSTALARGLFTTEPPGKPEQLNRVKYAHIVVESSYRTLFILQNWHSTHPLNKNSPLLSFPSPCKLPFHFLSLQIWLLSVTWSSLLAQWWRICLQCRRGMFDPWVGKIPWSKNDNPLQCSCLENSKSDTTEWLHFHFSLSCIGEGNGNPLQCSCLENPRDGGAWWAAVYGVA